jgi:pSer/pThr/pTyr-binding forkhead associated (FHA) protein
MTVRLADDGDPLAPHSISPSEIKMLIAAERTGQALLALRDGDGLLRIYDAPAADATMIIGRRPEAHLSIGWDGEVSGVHATLQDVAGELAILDDGLSRNGTFVNGQRVSGRQRLRDQDRVRVGRTVIVYRVTSAIAERTVVASDRLQVLNLGDSQRRVLVALCRPFRDGTSFAIPATNQQIAEEVCLSIDAVKTHLRALFTKFELGKLPQNQKRTRLAELALQLGVVNTRDLT